MTAPQRYPLAWPTHRPRRAPATRIRGDFVAGGKRITMLAACDKLEDQLQRLGAIGAVLSSDVEPRLDGRLRLGTQPADPGVCVYFALKGKALAMACDAYTTVEQNVAAIANHVDAVRRQERYGVASAEESLQAFAALPSPQTIALGGRSAWDILGLAQGSSEQAVRAAYRALVKHAHGTQAGDAAMTELNAARDAALKEIKS